MQQVLFDWALLLGRWLHITTGITWIGTSIFFMWLDRSFENGELWMVHGGGFYNVKKLQMGSVKVPDHLHWFKWESYWTWMSGFFLLAMIFYTGKGAFMVDTMISSITYPQALALSAFTLFGSWFFYDFLWESSLTKKNPLVGHALTLAWLGGMAYALCHLISGRAAYLHIGAMMGTWMTANVFLRIIPRQVKMVEAAKRGESVNPDWGKNAKNRSTHNTYFTLPVIFVMLSNHFPSTYGHDYNWLILLGISAAGAAIREFFVKRVNNPSRAKAFGLVGAGVLAAVIVFATHKPSAPHSEEAAPVAASAPAQAAPVDGSSLKGVVSVKGDVPKGKPLTLPPDCAAQHKGEVLSNEVLVHDGHLQNVLVRVIKGHENLPKGDVPPTPVELDQRGCLYVPRVIAARVGQEVVFINSDPTFHNVRSFSKKNENFNLAMPMQGQRVSERFTKPELFLQTKCSVHPWMGAYIAIVDHPFFSVTDANGAFEIKGLKPGKYTLEFWHEYYGTETKDVAVTDKGVEPVNVTFKK